MPKSEHKRPVSRESRSSQNADDSPRPFLKWAGGKRQLLPRLRRFYPDQFGNYFEPFVGSGAVFFDLHARGLLKGRDALLIDNSQDLVGCYRAVRDQAEVLIRGLRTLAKERQSDPAVHYYDVRDRRFNPMRSHLRDQEPRPLADAYTPELAAMLIYLNRTGFNGLFRQNARGGFNVPVGRYVNPRICDAANLRNAAAALSRTRTRILLGDFSTVLGQAKVDDFVYFDPPYAPLSATASFTSYTSGGFGEEEQVRLQKVVIDLANRGCKVVLSNSTAPLIERLYERDETARRAGLSAHRVPARRAINSKASARGQVLEYIITNVPERGE
ncbi:MAG TPA: Dam family site-specific DNA-(adenine-N6)-methyltransferase [Vicinamibacterales bacterium]|jgi:DNA adenine methylase